MFLQFINNIFQIIRFMGRGTHSIYSKKSMLFVLLLVWIINVTHSGIMEITFNNLKNVLNTYQ